jgi:hypothetical protein
VHIAAADARAAQYGQCNSRLGSKLQEHSLLLY